MDGKQFFQLDKRLKAMEQRLSAIVQLLEIQAQVQGVEAEAIESLLTSSQAQDPLQAYFNQGFFKDE